MIFVLQLPDHLSATAVNFFPHAAIGLVVAAIPVAVAFFAFRCRTQQIQWGLALLGTMAAFELPTPLVHRWNPHPRLWALTISTFALCVVPLLNAFLLTPKVKHQRRSLFAIYAFLAGLLVTSFPSWQAISIVSGGPICYVVGRKLIRHLVNKSPAEKTAGLEKRPAARFGDDDGHGPQKGSSSAGDPGRARPMQPPFQTGNAQLDIALMLAFSGYQFFSHHGFREISPDGTFIDAAEQKGFDEFGNQRLITTRSKVLTAAGRLEVVASIRTRCQHCSRFDSHAYVCEVCGQTLCGPCAREFTNERGERQFFCEPHAHQAIENFNTWIAWDFVRQFPSPASCRPGPLRHATRRHEVSHE